MATFIPEYSFDDIIKVRDLGKLQELQCGEVFDDGKFLFTFSNGNLELSGYQRALAEDSGQTCNSVGGRTLEDILGAEQDEVNPLACSECGKVCASEFGLRSHKRSHKELAHATV